MQLTPTLINQVYAHVQDKDLAHECFLVLDKKPERDSRYVLRIARQVKIDRFRREKLRSSNMSIDDPDFLEPISQAQEIDFEKYIREIKNKKLRTIIDQYIDKIPLTGNQRMYLHNHRRELDQDLTKYLKPVSPWMLLVQKVEPFRRSLKDLMSQFQIENVY